MGITNIFKKYKESEELTKVKRAILKAEWIEFLKKAIADMPKDSDTIWIYCKDNSDNTILTSSREPINSLDYHCPYTYYTHSIAVQEIAFAPKFSNETTLEEIADTFFLSTSCATVKYL